MMSIKIYNLCFCFFASGATGAAVAVAVFIVTVAFIAAHYIMFLFFSWAKKIYSFGETNYFSPIFFFFFSPFSGHKRKRDQN